MTNRVSIKEEDGDLGIPPFPYRKGTEMVIDQGCMYPSDALWTYKEGG